MLEPVCARCGEHENMDHILLSCNIAVSEWSSIASNFNQFSDADFLWSRRFSMSFVNSRVDWEKLVVDLFKCNAGAASSFRLGCSSFSAIIWDHNSTCFRGCSVTINTMWEVRMAELLAIREALSWMNTLNVANVVLES
ncbi:hypothetical protein J1N35_021251 [Gossypium stocksii]|uniref:Uncharacterized protein n=1 Tax=Gossypium stocksii TaxID=47602 RepID=A0A9D4A1S7_9ROSI|nr:hypothetical protein J1N35_021251 [Gossypium stocksii]